MADISYASHVQNLAPNNVGAITEEDILNIVEFAKPRGVLLGFKEVNIATGGGTNPVIWYGSNSGNPNPDTPPMYTPIVPNISLPNYSTYRHYLYEGDGNFIKVSTADKGGIVYSSGAGTARLFNFSWDTMISSVAARYLAIIFYHVPSGVKFGETDTRKHVNSFFTDVTISSRNNVSTTFYDHRQVGSASIILNPGDSLVPVLAFYGPDSGIGSGTTFSFNLSLSSAGVVEAWSPGSNYYDVVAGDSYEDYNVLGRLNIVVEPTISGTFKLDDKDFGLLNGSNVLAADPA